MLIKLRMRLAALLWPYQPKMVRVSRTIPNDSLHLFQDIAEEAMAELRSVGGDTTTVADAKITAHRCGRYFFAEWECRSLQDRWRINPYLPIGYKYPIDRPLKQ